MIFNMCCYKLYIYIHTSLQCLHNNNVPEIRFFYLKKYMLQYSISFYYIVTYCMCLFISSCVPVRCGSVPAGWVCPYRNTINTTMLNYWNIPEHQWAPANVELSWDGPHHSAGPPHTSIDLTKVTYTHRLPVLNVYHSQCGLCKYTYQWWGESVFLFISNKDLYLWVFIWFMCSYTREESCLYIHTFINTFIFYFLSYL